MFTLNLFPKVEINATCIGGHRVYHTPLGDFESVTTILNKMIIKEGLEEWKERVGEKEATKVATVAANIGKELHSNLEAFIYNPKHKVTNPFIIENYKNIREVLWKHITTVFGIEHILWSARLKTAGQSDLICLWDNIPTVLDFKTSKKEKQEQYILNYFLQTTCYAKMTEERYGKKIEQIVLIISIESNPIPQIFIKQTKDYEDLVDKVFVYGEKIQEK